MPSLNSKNMILSAMKKSLTRKQIRFRENAANFFQALGVTIVVVLIFAKLFLYQETKPDSVDKNKSGGFSLLTVKSFGNDPAVMKKWLMIHDPALLVKGSPDFGYAGYTREFLARPLDIRIVSADIKTPKPEMSFMAPLTVQPAPPVVIPDLSLSQVLAPERVVVLADDGGKLDCTGFFQQVPGGAEKATMVRVVGGKEFAQSVILLQSCDRPELDRYAICELSRMPLPAGSGVYSVIWPEKGKN